jgi:hypothetical protein
MRLGIAFKTLLVGIASVLLVASASAQQVRFYPDFTSVANLQLNGARQATFNGQNVLRLTNGSPLNGVTTGTAWFSVQQAVNMGFTTYFRFQIHNPAGCCNPSDGLAFVVQNGTSDPTYGASGTGTTVRGVGDGGLGYTGIKNSLAVEFDTSMNAWDPSSNHVAVQGCGTNTNGPVHDSHTYSFGTNHNVKTCLVNSAINSNIPPLGLLNCGVSSCNDGNPHDVVVEYAPVNSVWTLKVWIDPMFIAGTHTPVSSAIPAINIPYNIDNTQNSKGISLAGGTSAWVGFAASQGAQPQQQDIIAWEFTPHTPAEVQQVIPPGGTQADYIFGVHDTAVTYFSSFVNDPVDPYLMTIVATPTTRAAFHKNRLVGTPFANEQCVVYLGTGGNCIVYSITCQRQSNPHVDVTCPASTQQCVNVGDPGCIIFSTSYTTSDGITATNADYIKADPIGTNMWVSIFTSYNPAVFDGQTTGRGGTPSDFAATFKVGAQ